MDPCDLAPVCLGGKLAIDYGLLVALSFPIITLGTLLLVGIFWRVNDE